MIYKRGQESKPLEGLKFKFLLIKKVIGGGDGQKHPYPPPYSLSASTPLWFFNISKLLLSHYTVFYESSLRYCPSPPSLNNHCYPPTLPFKPLWQRSYYSPYLNLPYIYVLFSSRGFAKLLCFILLYTPHTGEQEQ